MPESVTISRQSPESSALDFGTLRREGIEYLQKVVGDLWSDYNVHDPGVTLLELLCFGITDIAYRTSFPDGMLFAPPQPRGKEEEGTESAPVPGPETPPFVSAGHALTRAPLTPNDYRKLFLDRFSELRNIWFDDVTETLHVDPDREEYALHSRGAEWMPFDVRGLYRIRLLLENDLPKKKLESLIETVRRFYYEHRNLCEDFSEIEVTRMQDIVVCAEIRLAAGADIEATHAAVLHALRSFLNPGVKRHTLAELAARGMTPDEIFNGPRLSGGFILEDELEAAKSDGFVRTSDLIRVVMSVPGVESISRIQLNFPPRRGVPSVPDDWELTLKDGHEPRLTFENAKLQFYKQKLPFVSDADEVKKQVAALRDAEDAALKSVGGPFDRPIPYETPLELGRFTSLQEALPLTYQVGSQGFDAGAEPARLAQAKQLQGFLLIFDQLLANYLGQIVHLHDLFSTRPGQTRSYFAQAVEDLPGLGHLLEAALDLENPAEGEAASVYADLLDRKMAAHDPAPERRCAMLEHLLSRFGESFADYVLSHQSLHVGDPLEALVESKRLFLSDLPELSYRRAQAHDVLDPERVWDTDNVSGFEARLSRILGFRSSDRRDVSSAKPPADGERDDRMGEGMFVVENLLFRPSSLTVGRKFPELARESEAAREGSTEEFDWSFLPAPCDASRSRPQSWDPYSFRIHIILPGYGFRLEQPMFRRFVEDMVARELPAHLHARICFVGRKHLADFEKKYRAWLTALAKEKVDLATLRALRRCLEDLHSIYPPGTLHDCKEDGDEDSAIVLDDTHIGDLPPPEEGLEFEGLRMGDFDPDRPPATPRPLKIPKRPPPEKPEPEPEPKQPLSRPERPPAKPEVATPATKKPKPATKKPKPATKRPTPATKRPTPATKKPKPATKKPKPATKRPTPAIVRPTPATKKPKPATKKPKPATKRPTPAIVRPTPATKKPKPATKKPKPATKRPTPAIVRPTPATKKPKPATKKPKPATKRPTPAIVRPTPATKKPKPATEKPKPAIKRAGPAIVRPTPATKKPKPATKKPKPATKRPTPAIVRPTPATKKPKPATKKPKPAIKRAGPAIVRPTPATKKPKPATKKPKPTTKARAKTKTTKKAAPKPKPKPKPKAKTIVQPTRVTRVNPFTTKAARIRPRPTPKPATKKPKPKRKPR